MIDEIVPEPPGGAHTDHAATAKILQETLNRHVEELRKFRPEKLVRRRRQKFLRLGQWDGIIWLTLLKSPFAATGKNSFSGIIRILLRSSLRSSWMPIAVRIWGMCIPLASWRRSETAAALTDAAPRRQRARRCVLRHAKDERCRRSDSAERGSAAQGDGACARQRACE